MPDIRNGPEIFPQTKEYFATITSAKYENREFATAYFTLKINIVLVALMGRMY